MSVGLKLELCAGMPLYDSYGGLALVSLPFGKMDRISSESRLRSEPRSEAYGGGLSSECPLAGVRKGLRGESKSEMICIRRLDEEGGKAGDNKMSGFVFKGIGMLYRGACCGAIFDRA